MTLLITLKMQLSVLLLVLIICLGNRMRAQTSLTSGDIAFTGHNCNNASVLQNDFSFVLLANISAGTTSNFTDNGYKIASPTFISGIHMNSDPTTTQAGWDNMAAGTTLTQNRNDVPPGLTSEVNCIAPDSNIGTSERDNGRYNFTGATGATLASKRTLLIRH